MKNIVSSFAKLVAVAACALTLGSCSRAEYAMLPKGSSYHGVARAATPVPAAAKTVAVAPAEAATAAQPAAAPVVAAAPAKAMGANAPAAAAASAVVPKSSVAAATVAAAPAPKLSLVQRLAVAKVTKKLQKAVQKSGTARQHDNTAATQKLSGKLRQGLILVLVGVLIEILAAAVGSGLIYLLGALLILVGLVLIVLYLLDEL